MFSTKKQRRNSGSLTVIGHTLIEVQAAHDTNYEVNEGEDRRKSRHRAEKGPLNEGPAECRRIEHETPSDEIQSTKDEEHCHRQLQLLPRSEPTLESALVSHLKMYVVMYHQKPGNE